MGIRRCNMFDYEYPLNINDLLYRARDLFPKKELVTRFLRAFTDTPTGIFISGCANWPMPWTDWA